MQNLTKLMDNPVYKEILNRFANQQEKGFAKYGTYVNIDDYDFIGWCEHAQQEATDWIVYLEAMKQKYLEDKTK